MEIKISTYHSQSSKHSALMKQIVKSYEGWSGCNSLTFKPDFMHFYDDKESAIKDFNKVYEMYKSKGAKIITDNDNEKELHYKKVIIKLFINE